MPKKPARIHTAQSMADAVHAYAGVQSKALEIAPHAFGPMSRIPTQVPGAEEIETLSAHCFTCKSKRGESKSEFDVDPAKTTKMKNGAIMKQGKCKADGCGQTLSAFVKGTQEAAA